MNKSSKTILKKIIISCVALFFVFALSGAAFYGILTLAFSPEDQLQEYLSSFSHNGKTVYVEDGYIHINGVKYDKNNLEISKVVGITSNQIYYAKGKVIYSSNYDFSNLKEVCTFNDDGSVQSIKIRDNYIMYQSDRCKIVYNIDNKSFKEVVDFSEIDYKSYDIVYSRENYTLTNKETKEERIINKDSLVSNVVQVKEANSICGGGIQAVYVIKEKIYITYRTYFTIIFCEYDFETDSYYYRSWSGLYNPGDAYFAE